MMLVSVWKKIPKQTVWVLLALGAGLLLLLPKHTSSAEPVKTLEFSFSLEEEEKRIEDLVLAIDTSMSTSRERGR